MEFKEDADVLIKMANDDTDEYEVYGIMSAEYGAFGLLLNDKKEGPGVSRKVIGLPLISTL